MNSNTTESVDMARAIRQAIQLNSKGELLWHSSYSKRLTPDMTSFENKLIRSWSLSEPIVKKYYLPRVKEPIRIRNKAKLTKTCRQLLRTKNISEHQSLKIFRLALNYYNTTGQFQDITHSFLIQMVIFEA